MGKIELYRIKKEKNRIQFEYSVSEDLMKFFSETPFWVQYTENIETVPDSIASVVFVSNVLPIVWITNSTLVVPELDKTFYECISEVKVGYKQMFPETEFLGEIKVEKVICNSYPKTKKCAMFFSGGLDSVQTLISHERENPELIAIWGSDIKYNNSNGWALVEDIISEIAKRFSLNNVIIRSTFREFDNESVLSRTFAQQLQDGWWHGVKHGIALLGHVAPYVWLHQISVMYIASSYCPEDGKVRCASSPLTDNYVRFASCKVIHDGFQYSRQDKIHNLVEYCHQQGKYIPLHVCWQSQDGENCCYCEKCYRTMAGLWAEGDNPEQYAFTKASDGLDKMQYYIVNNAKEYKEEIKKFWVGIQKRAIENKRLLKQKDYYPQYKWLLKADFKHPECLSMPILYRIKERMSQFSFYKKLHILKEKIQL